MQTLKMRHRLLRRDVVFSDDNDHNPIVDDECADCFGSGKRDRFSDNRKVQELISCSACHGSGSTGRKVPYFDNDSPPVEVTVNEHGWLQCPCCGRRFTTSDPNVWTGRRHSRCGQRIVPIAKKA